MTFVDIPQGPFKRDLIRQAYEECGQAAYDYDLSPEEYASALRRMNNMLAEWQDGQGINLGYNFPNNGTDGNVEDASGIPPAASQIVSLKLAERIAPLMGKTLTPETKAAMARAWGLLLAHYAVVPEMCYGRNTLRGAGNRRNSWRGPFFPTCPRCNQKVGYPYPNSCGCSAQARNV